MNDNFQVGGLALLQELQKKAPKGKWESAQAIEAINDVRTFLRDYLELEAAEELFVTSPRNPAEMTPTEAIAEAKSLLQRFGEVVQTIAMAEGDVIAANTSFPEELGNIDFAKLIGGPLQAAVQAQVSSSIAGANFIKEVGFKEDKVVNVEFTYDRVSTGADGSQVTESRNVKVPLLSMLIVPSLRIEEVNIDFNVKLNSVATQNTSTSIGIASELGLKFGVVNFKATGSFQRTSTSGIEVKKEYNMAVKVRAVQDVIPAGLDRILNMLAESVQDKPADQ